MNTEAVTIKRTGPALVLKAGGVPPSVGSMLSYDK